MLAAAAVSRRVRCKGGCRGGLRGSCPSSHGRWCDEAGDAYSGAGMAARRAVAGRRRHCDHMASRLCLGSLRCGLSLSRLHMLSCALVLLAFPKAPGFPSAQSPADHRCPCVCCATSWNCLTLVLHAEFSRAS